MSRSPSVLVSLSASLVVLAACGEARPVLDEGPVEQCARCHGFPPLYVPPHTPDLTSCQPCHPEPPGATHANGRVDLQSPHAGGYASPTVHGPQFLDQLAGVPGALACRACHGEDLSLCGSCHSSAASGAWERWETNCTFCHGTRTPAYDGGLLASASPAGSGDTVRMRLEGTTTVTTADTYRIGKHRSHVLQEGGASDAYPALPCATCHAVPATVEHVGAGPDRRATVVFEARQAFPGLTEAQLAALPDPLVAYAPHSTTASGTIHACATYCHGSDPLTGAALWGGEDTRPQWRTTYANVSCTSCHSNPPPTGKLVVRCDTDGDGVLEPCTVHAWHDLAANGSGCGSCHPPATAATHVSGVKDVTSSGWDPATRSCSAVACHADPGTRSWYE
jgi:hypothetical protein